MSTSATLLAIDAAILAGVSGPGEIQTADGRRIKYRTLNELLEARQSLAAQSVAEAANPFAQLRFARINSGGTI